MASCAELQPDNTIVITTEPLSSCAGYVVLDVADYAAATPWGSLANLFDMSDPGYWSMLSAAVAMMGIAYVYREIGASIKRR